MKPWSFLYSVRFAAALGTLLLAVVSTIMFLVLGWFGIFIVGIIGIFIIGIFIVGIIGIFIVGIIGIFIVGIIGIFIVGIIGMIITIRIDLHDGNAISDFDYGSTSVTMFAKQIRQRDQLTRFSHRSISLVQDFGFLRGG